jgi:hypothetical protein
VKNVAVAILIEDTHALALRNTGILFREIIERLLLGQLIRRNRDLLIKIEIACKG